eukprot:GDKJ01008228.1.p1 GENE.GDKJ01008228.1~~GDKJ01008228.1.p1  ORF type:complete len:197 (-),score=12.15 GDKJ01008228.1:117-707(-)
MMHVNQILGIALIMGLFADHFMWDSWVKAMRQRTGQKVLTKDPTISFFLTITIASISLVFLGLLNSSSIYGDTWTGTILRFFSLLFGFSGLYLFHQAHVHLAENWMPTVSKLQDQKLVTTGPYKYVRHPMYTAMTMITFAYFSLFAASVWTWPLLTSWFLMISYRIPVEDKLMADLFKDRHAEWKKNTFRLIPFLW